MKFAIKNIKINNFMKKPMLKYKKVHEIKRIKHNLYTKKSQNLYETRGSIDNNNKGLIHIAWAPQLIKDSLSLNSKKQQLKTKTGQKIRRRNVIYFNQNKLNQFLYKTIKNKYKQKLQNEKYKSKVKQQVNFLVNDEDHYSINDKNYSLVQGSSQSLIEDQRQFSTNFYGQILQQIRLQKCFIEQKQEFIKYKLDLQLQQLQKAIQSRNQLNKIKNKGFYNLNDQYGVVEDGQQYQGGRKQVILQTNKLNKRQIQNKQYEQDNQFTQDKKYEQNLGNNQYKLYQCLVYCKSNYKKLLLNHPTWSTNKIIHKLKKLFYINQNTLSNYSILYNSS